MWPAIDLWDSWFKPNPVRWVEIHPPDTIEVIDDRQMNETFRGVLAGAWGTFLGKPRRPCTVDVDLVAPPKPAGATRLGVQEFVGPESDLGTIIDGNPSGTGARLTVEADRVHVHVTVAGGRGLIPRLARKGKFKALYRVFWISEPGECEPLRAQLATKRRDLETLQHQLSEVMRHKPIDEEAAEALQIAVETKESEIHAVAEEMLRLGCQADGA
jgi:hypothetical protein